MNIGVVFEIIASALAVIGMYSLVCEFIRGVLCRGKYYIAVHAGVKPKREILEDVYMARRLIDITSGASHRIILLVDSDDRIENLSDINADIYVKMKTYTEN